MEVEVFKILPSWQVGVGAEAELLDVFVSVCGDPKADCVAEVASAPPLRV